MEMEKLELFGYDLTEWKEKLSKEEFSEIIVDIAIAVKGRIYIEDVINETKEKNKGIKNALEINLKTFLKSKDNDFYEKKRYMN